MFSVYTTQEKFENVTTTGQFGFVFEETLAGKSRDYRDVIFSNCVLLTLNTKLELDKFVLKSVFGKLCFRDGLVRTVGLKCKYKAPFSNSSVEV